MSTLTNDALLPAMLLAHGRPEKALRWNVPSAINIAHEWMCEAFDFWYSHRGRHKHKLDNYDKNDRKTFCNTGAWFAFQNWCLYYNNWLHSEATKRGEVT